eukprot:10731-Chlamydomonas_euryale.AAC.2
MLSTPAAIMSTPSAVPPPTSISCRTNQPCCPHLPWTSALLLTPAISLPLTYPTPYLPCRCSPAARALRQSSRAPTSRCGRWTAPPRAGRARSALPAQAAAAQGPKRQRPHPRGGAHAAAHVRGAFRAALCAVTAAHVRGARSKRSKSVEVWVGGRRLAAAAEGPELQRPDTFGGMPLVTHCQPPFPPSHTHPKDGMPLIKYGERGEELYLIRSAPRAFCTPPRPGRHAADQVRRARRGALPDSLWPRARSTARRQGRLGHRGGAQARAVCRRARRDQQHAAQRRLHRSGACRGAPVGCVGGVGMEKAIFSMHMDRNDARPNPSA